MPVLGWLLKNWKSVMFAALLAGTYWLGDGNGSSRVQADWDKERAATSEQRLKDAAINAKTIYDLEVQRDKNQAAVNKFAADNRDLRLRLPVSEGRCEGVPAAAGGGGEATAGVEPFPGKAQAALDGYTEGVKRLMHEADTVVNDCRVLQAWAKSLERKR